MDFFVKTGYEIDESSGTGVSTDQEVRRFQNLSFLKKKSKIKFSI